jgi:hypothetical protein
MKKITDEPVLSAAAVNAIVALIASLGLHLSPAVIGAIVSVLSIALGFLARSQVTPVPSPPVPPVSPSGSEAHKIG